MITEDRVTFDIAKLLRDKGFPQNTFEIDCNVCYKYNGKLCNNAKSMSGVDREISYMAPTLQMAIKWLREVHNIYIAVNITYSKEPKLFPPEYYVHINNTLTGESLIKEVCSLVQDKTLTPKGFKHSKIASEAAIKYVLEKLI